MADDARARLNDHLDRLGWSQQALAGWLTEVTGDNVGLRTVHRWVSGGEKDRCPGWPSALIELSGILPED
jgi:hypothetical protein